MTARIVDGRIIAKQIKNQIQKEITIIKEKNLPIPKIITLLIGNDPSSELYLKLRDNACTETGIISTHTKFLSTVEETKVLETIQQLNKDPTVHGILIQYPLPKQFSTERFMNAIAPEKDVEGFHPLNMGKTLIGDEQLVPCTPRAVLTILEHEHVDVKGKDVVIVNHSAVVGKPLAALLLNRNATTTICHVYTKDLIHYTSCADILITATGIPRLITKNHVKEGAFIIDVGIVQIKDGVCGDVDFQEVKEKAGKITPVPGGVGPVTIACSLQNMMKTYQNCLHHQK